MPIFYLPDTTRIEASGGKEENDRECMKLKMSDGKIFSTINPTQKTRTTIHNQHTKVVKSVAKLVRDKSRIDLSYIDPDYLYLGLNMWIPGAKDGNDNEEYE